MIVTQSPSGREVIQIRGPGSYVRDRDDPRAGEAKSHTTIAQWQSSAERQSAPERRREATDDRFQRDKSDQSVIAFSEIKRCQLLHSTQFFQKAKKRHSPGSTVPSGVLS